MQTNSELHLFSMPAPRSAEAGFSVLEVTAGMALLAVVSLTTMSMTLTSFMLKTVNRETALATDAARQVIESIEQESFAEVFARHNVDPADDPAGAGTALGNLVNPAGSYTVGAGPTHGTTAALSGVVAKITFPNEVGGQLREDVGGGGVQWDLDADGAIGTLNLAATYRFLPITVTVQWLGKGGRRQVEVQRVLTQRGS